MDPLNHVKYENCFSLYDVVEPQQYLLKNSKPQDLRAINTCYSSLESIPTNNKYDKIISIACLEHIHDLNRYVAKIKNHLAENGKLIAAIPAEGEFLWWISWRLSTGIAFWLKYKLDYGVIMRHEHVNNVEEIIENLRNVFSNIKSVSFPFHWKHYRIYIVIECSDSAL